MTGSSVPIGWPVWNTGLRILDAAMRPVPPGVAGDLYLTGIQLAQGYLGRPDLTASRFIADPFAPGERMYRTGDVARWLTNGAVEYLGRSDDQLKIRGQRIELGEIDRVMLALPDVGQAVSHACVFNQAAATGGDARQLVGYLVSDSGLPLDTAALKARLAEQLPPHMVPVVLMQLAELPLSANGKLDRKALPLPTLGGERSGRPPEPGMETLVAAAFSQLLGCEVNDIDADFFALGGHSLLAMRLAAQLSRQLARQVTPGQVMVASTVGKLSALLAADLSDEPGPAPGAGYASAAARERRPDAVLLPSRLRLRLAVQRAGALSQPALVDYRYSVAAPAGADGQRRQPRRGVRASSAHAAGAAAARPLLPVRVFAGRHLSPGDCRPLAPARRSGGLPRPGWIPGRRRRKTGRRKRPTGWIPRYWRRSTASAKRSSPPSRGKPPASCSALSKATMPMRCGC